MTEKYDHEVAHHDPREGFDRSEPAAKKITFFVIISVITLVVTILALQAYFDKIWNAAVYEKVLAVPGEELGDTRSLSSWRLSHYEYTDPTKTTVRMPYEHAKELFLAEQAEGKTFYPAKATEPKPEEPADAAKPEAGKQQEAGKQPEAGKQQEAPKK